MRTSPVDPKKRRFLTALLAAAIQPLTATANTPTRFRVFDALFHQGKPDLTRLGFESIWPVANIWRPDQSHDDVDDSGVAIALDHLPKGTKTIYLDIERWPLYQVDTQVMKASISKMARVATLVRRLLPQIQFGFYSAPPIRVYWPILRQDASYQQWLVSDGAMEPLARQVDYTFPSLYTFYADSEGWRKFAAGQLREARRYQKPVYPFLWYRYHDSNRLLRGHEIDSDAWRQELAFCRTHADGVVLWGGSGEDWDEHAAWWQIVRRTLGLHQS